jgi:hypothetical protein
MIKYKKLKQDRKGTVYKYDKNIHGLAEQEFNGKIEEQKEWSAENETRKKPPPRLTAHNKVFD